MQDKSFIEKIEQLSKTNILEVGGRNYSDAQIYAVTNPGPQPLKLNSLTGLVDYLKRNVDKLLAADLMIHVEGHDRVDLYHSLDPMWQTRKHLISVGLEKHGEGFKYGSKLDSENFVISLQANFVKTANLAKVLKVAGTMRSENSVGVADDGITQSVELKAGVVLSSRGDVPNPVALAPFRTFTEISQPESDFVFRVHQAGANSPPTCSLHEADGGRWKIEAIYLIRNFLKELVGEIAIIA